MQPENDGLPRDFSEALERQQLAPLWRVIRSLIRYELPVRSTQPALWRYADLRPLLLRAGELVPIELAERRTLALCNPGLSADVPRATPTMFVGFQLLLPREAAANHRHAAHALRLVVEGEGAYTTVGGERLRMEPGDLLLTPGGRWHEHGQERDEPVIWLDALDVPLVYYLEASIAEPGSRQDAPPGTDAATTRFRHGGLVPHRELGSDEAYPLLRFPWQQTRAALLELERGSARDEAVHLAYVNPLTGGACLPTLGCSALLLRPGEKRRLRRRSASAVLHVVEGGGDVAVDEASFACDAHDVVAVPTYATVELVNRSSAKPAFFVVIDDAPLQRLMRIYRELD